MTQKVPPTVVGSRERRVSAMNAFSRPSSFVLPSVWVVVGHWLFRTLLRGRGTLDVSYLPPTVLVFYPLPLPLVPPCVTPSPCPHIAQARAASSPAEEGSWSNRGSALVFVVTMSMSPRDDDARDDGCIRIPVRGAQQTVEVYTEELPSDYNDVVDVLKAEIAPLDIWLRFAVSGDFRASHRPSPMVLRNGSSAPEGNLNRSTHTNIWCPAGMFMSPAASAPSPDW